MTTSYNFISSYFFLHAMQFTILFLSEKKKKTFCLQVNTIIPIGMLLLLISLISEGPIEFMPQVEHRLCDILRPFLYTSLQTQDTTTSKQRMLFCTPFQICLQKWFKLTTSTLHCNGWKAGSLYLLRDDQMRQYPLKPLQEDSNKFRC